MNSSGSSIPANMASGKGIVNPFGSIFNSKPKASSSSPPKVNIVSSGKKNHGFSLGTFNINGSKGK